MRDADILGVDKVSVNDSFFELGGDSLLAMQVLNRIRRLVSAELSFRDLLGKQTIAELAKLVEERKVASPQVASLIRTPNRQSDIPLTLAQQGIWFLWRLEPDSPYYTGQGTLQLRGDFDQLRFQKVWSALLEHHQILRVRFDSKDGQPIQNFDDRLADLLQCTDLTHLPADEQWRVIEDRANKKSQCALNLERDQLFQAELY